MRSANIGVLKENQWSGTVQLSDAILEETAMVRRTTKSGGAAEPKPKSVLMVPRGEAEEKLGAQVREGEELMARQPNWSEESLQRLKDDAQTWAEFTFGLPFEIFQQPTRFQ